MKHLTLTLLWACSFLPSLHAVAPYQSGDTLYVWASSGLRLRSEPNGSIISTLPFGTAVVMQQHQPDTGALTIEKLRGYWVQINGAGRTGYVFDGLLGALPTPAKQIYNLMDYCNHYFQHITGFDCYGSDGENVGGAIFQYKDRKVVYVESGGGGPEIYSYNGSLIVTPTSLEEMYLFFKHLHRNNPDIKGRIHPGTTRYTSDAEDAEWWFDEKGVYWNFSH